MKQVHFLVAILSALVLCGNLDSASAQSEWHVVDDMTGYFGEFSQSKYSSIVSVSPAQLAVIGGFGNVMSFIRVSTDGGRSWRFALKDTTLPTGKPDAPVNFARNITELAAVPPYTLIAAGDSGTVWRSIDWGETWTEGQPGSKAVWKTLSMTGSGDGLLLQYPRRLLRTTDAGATWSDAAVDTSSWPIGFQLLQAHVLSRERWIFVFSKSGERRTGRTTDGGVHWEFSPSLSIYSLAARPNGQIVTVGSGPMNEPPPSQRMPDVIQRSEDDGGSWQVIRNEIGDPGFGLTDVAFADNANGVAVGRDAKALRTTDGGRSWSDLMDGLDFGSVITMTGVTYPTPNVAFASTASGRVYKCEFQDAAVRDGERSGSVRMRMTLGEGNGELHLYGVYSGAAQLTIFDLVGRVVHAGPVECQPGETVVRLPVGLPRAPYLVALRTRGEEGISRVLMPE